MKNLVLSIGALILVIVGIFIFTKKQTSQNDTIIPTPIAVGTPSPSLQDSRADQADMKVPFTTLKPEEIQGKKVTIQTKKGNIVFELFGDSPITSSNFIYLVNKNFYNGLTFHRREEGFVIQGGDPNGTGTGGPGYTFGDEPVKLEYERGIVAMANAGPDTNGSQFFIMLKTVPLPKNYTIFGRVTEGIEVVDKIQIGDVMDKVTLK